MKEEVDKTLLILWTILDHIFGTKKDNFFALHLFSARGMSNTICDLVLYLQSEGLNIS